MLKKKNIAMMMAATTVATSVAPVFAAVEVQNVDEATLIAQVEKMLAKKYSNEEVNGLGTTIAEGDEYTNSVYDIQANITTNGTVTSAPVKSVKELKQMIEQAKISDTLLNKTLVLTVTDKGHKEVDGKIVASETTKNRYYGTSADADAVTFESQRTAIENLGATFVVNGDYATIRLANGKEIELANGDYVLDIAKPVDANGNLISVSGSLANTDALARRINGFELVEDTKVKQDIPSKHVETLNLDTRSNFEIEKKSSDILTKDGYTEEGAKFVNAIRDAKSATNTVVKDGVKYNVTNAVAGTVTTVKDGGYEVVITLIASKVSDNNHPSDSNVKITISGDTQKDLTTIVTDINGANDVVDVDGKVEKLVGETRFETAVEVSKKAFKGKNDKLEAGETTASSIILVGENAIVDGLAAAPLAAEKNAPILLTKKDAIPASTMAEIKRLVGKGTTVYVVGGEANISKAVETELINEMNANIVRLAGDNRFETSLEIAEELSNKNDAFVVGGDGLADAMSIASLAADRTNIRPVIVTPADGLTKDAKNFLQNNPGATTVVGGEVRVSTQVLKDIKATGNTVTRIAGENRNDTNAKVIATLASNSLDNVYVAKDGNNALVDALAAAPLAGANNGVIVLATNDITEAQNDAIKDAKKATTKLTQVGGGVATTVVEKLVKLLGL